MQNREILNVGAATDFYAVYITPDDNIEPDTGLSANLNISDNYSCFRDECSPVNCRGDTLERSDHKAPRQILTALLTVMSVSVMVYIFVMEPTASFSRSPK